MIEFQSNDTTDSKQEVFISGYCCKARWILSARSKEGLFIEILKKENFETIYYLGEREGFKLP